MLTSDNQQSLDILHSIYEYLLKHGFQKSAQMIKTEGNLEFSDQPTTGLVSKMALRIQQLEEELEHLKSDISAFVLTRTPSLTKINLTSKAVFHGLVQSVAFHPRLSILAVANSNYISLVDGKGNLLTSAECNHRPTKVKFSTGAGLWVSSDEEVAFYNIDGLRFEATVRLQGHSDKISNFFCPEDETIVTCSRDKTMKVWEASSGFLINTIDTFEWIRAICGDWEFEIIACGGDRGIITIRDTMEWKIVHEITAHEHVIESMVIVKGSSEKELVLWSAGRDKTVKAWIITKVDGIIKSSLARKFAYHGWVMDLAQLNEYVIGVGDSDKLYFWDLHNEPQVLETGHCNSINRIEVHPTLNILATASMDNSIRLHNY